MKEIKLTLDDYETAAMGGWVKWLAANPSFIGVPPPANPVPPATWQTRIVLSSSARSRYEQIAAQFVEDIIILPEWKWGMPDFKWRAQPGIIYAIPLTMGPEPYAVTNILSASSASDSPPALRRGALNLIAGDMTDAQTGVQVTLDAVVSPGSFIKPSTKCFYNVTMEEGHPSSEGRFSCPNWPR